MTILLKVDNNVVSRTKTTPREAARYRPGQHTEQESLRLLLLIHQLLGSLGDNVFQVIGVLLHDGQHVVEDVWMPANKCTLCSRTETSTPVSVITFLLSHHHHTVTCAVIVILSSSSYLVCMYACMHACMYIYATI